MFCLTDSTTFEADAAACQLAEFRVLATVSTADVAEPTLGVVTGSLEKVEEQLRYKVDVMKAMHTWTVICQDVRTEHVLNQQSLGIGMPYPACARRPPVASK